MSPSEDILQYASKSNQSFRGSATGFDPNQSPEAVRVMDKVMENYRRFQRQQDLAQSITIEELRGVILD